MKAEYESDIAKAYTVLMRQYDREAEEHEKTKALYRQLELDFQMLLDWQTVDNSKNKQ